MARTVDEINTYVVTKLVENFAAIGITINPTLWSKRNFLRLICFTMAAGMALMEQLMDLYEQRIEDTASKSPGASALWVQDKMFKFQYSATDPQVIALVDTIPQYPTVDESLRIITGCSVTSTVGNETTIKVAKGFPFVKLDTLEKDAAQSMIDIIGIAGIKYIVVSLDSDKLFIEADCYYQGQYSAVIQANTIAALEAWMQSLSTKNLNGIAKMSELENVIRTVPGMNDVVLKNVRGRKDTDLFSAGINLITNTQVLQRRWITIAGYIGQETDPGHTFADSLTFIPE